MSPLLCNAKRRRLPCHAMCRSNVGMMGAPPEFAAGLPNSPAHCIGKESPMHNGSPVSALVRESRADRRFGNVMPKASVGKRIQPARTYPRYPPFDSNVCADRLAAPSNLTSFCTSVALLSCTCSCPVMWTCGWWSCRSRGNTLCRQAGCNNAGDTCKPGHSEDRTSYQRVFSLHASLIWLLAV
jgi:hypothetical protein